MANLLLILLSLCLAEHLRAQTPSAVPLPFVPKEGGGIARPWDLKVKTGRPRMALVPSGEEIVLHMRCDNASFSVQRALGIDPRAFPIIRWKWRVTALPPRGDVREAARNDQAVQLLLLFERAGGGYKAISYVWDSNAPPGTTTHERWNFIVYRVDVKVLVIESGSTRLGEWIAHERNVLDDYRSLYGEEPDTTSGIRLQTNCQYTDSSAEGYFARPEFTR